MSGSLQKSAMLRALPIGWQMQFAYLGTSNKMTCIVCGITGYQYGNRPSGWQVSCLIGHPDQCQTCGARFVKGGLAKHLRCRLGHTHCPNHLDTQHRRLERLKEGSST